MRDARWKYATYFDPCGRTPSEYELYDLRADPDEGLNLVDKHTGDGRTPQACDELPRLRELLDRECEQAGYARPPPG